MKSCLCALVLSVLSGCATAPSQISVAADAATTASALSVVPGAAEANPLGWATVPIRLAIIQHALHQPIAEGIQTIHHVQAASWGAAANNALIVLGAATPLSLAGGAAVWYAVWKSGENEREFWQICAALRAENRGLACAYTPPQGS
jgi:hypothetical protein